MTKSIARVTCYRPQSNKLFYVKNEANHFNAEKQTYAKVGAREGILVGLVGMLEGMFEGNAVGAVVGNVVGLSVGVMVGEAKPIIKVM